MTRPIFLCKKIDADTYAKGLPTMIFVHRVMISMTFRKVVWPWPWSEVNRVTCFVFTVMGSTILHGKINPAMYHRGYSPMTFRWQLTILATFIGYLWPWPWSECNLVTCFVFIVMGSTILHGKIHPAMYHRGYDPMTLSSESMILTILPVSCELDGRVRSIKLIFL